jgi:hypothetical protein
MEVITSLQPDLFILGLRIQEPITMITDFLISAVCIYAFIQIKRKTKTSKLNSYTQYYFLLMAIATLWGGFFGHGFQYIFGFAMRYPGWYISMFSIMLIERASIEHSRSFIQPKFIKILLYINILELIVLIALTTITLKFIFVQIHSVYGVLGVVFGFQLYRFIKDKDKGSLYMLIGVAVAFAAAFVYNFPVILSPWFNNLDFAHVLMAIASLYFLKGSLNYQENTKDSLEELRFSSLGQASQKP